MSSTLYYARVKSEVKLSNINVFGPINSRVKLTKRQRPKQLTLKRSQFNNSLHPIESALKPLKDSLKSYLHSQVTANM